MNDDRKCRVPLARAIAAAFSVWILVAGSILGQAQQPSGAIRGRVLNTAGQPVAGAGIQWRLKGASSTKNVRADARGDFAIPGLTRGVYVLRAESNGMRSRAMEVQVPAEGTPVSVDIVFEIPKSSLAGPNKSPRASNQLEFVDEPNFTVAGVTDWTAAGGHGNDTSLRASEALTRETMTLKAGPSAPNMAVPHATAKTEDELRVDLAVAPESFSANHALGAFYLAAGKYEDAIPLLETAFGIDRSNAENEYDLALAREKTGDFELAHEHIVNLLDRGGDAKAYHLAAEIDERRGDPLAAVREYEEAARRDPSEQNFFDWGSELLYHRAVWQAKEVFERGTKAYPESERMLTALGGTLFAGALYDEAAERLCQASDMNPADPEPYLFMGKIEMAAPNPLACVGPKLERFQQEQPGSALANYYYAMALWKQAAEQADEPTLNRVESMLEHAVTVDAKCSDAYMQLGNLYATRKNYPEAINFYNEAIGANPQLAEAHYRLGVAYDRIGKKDRANQEFQLHEKLEKEQAAEVERQRREVKQFLVVQSGKPAGKAPQ